MTAFDFGELRSFLTGHPPGDQLEANYIYLRLLELLAPFDLEELEPQVLPYLQRQLERWPFWRYLPRRSLPAFLNGDRQIACLLSNALAVRRFDDRRSQALSSSPFLGQLRKLLLVQGLSSRERLERFLGQPALQALEELEFSAGILSDLQLLQLLADLPLPSLRHLKVSGLRPDALHLRQANIWPRALLGQLETLDLGGHALPAQALEQLFDAPMPNLEALDLSCREGSTALASMLSAARLPSLQQLNLSGALRAEATDPVEGSLRTLGEARWAGQLHKLELALLGMGDEALAIVARADWATLRSLRLDNNALESIAPLQEASFAGSLEELSLSYNQLEDDSGAVLTSEPLASGLRKVELRANALGARFCQALADYDVTRWLESLDLATNPLDSSCLVILGQARWLASLRQLDLSLLQAPIEPEDLAALGEGLRGGRLRDLRLWSLGLDPRALQVLLQAPCLGSLERLGLDHNPLGDEGLRMLCESEALPRLYHLGLLQVGLSAAGLETLQKSALYERLRWIALREDALPASMTDALLKP